MILRGATAALVLFIACTVYGQTSTTQLLSALSSPVFITSPAGDDGRLFLLEQETGQVRVIDLSTNTLLNSPYLTVDNLARFGERGLLGLAFHPDFSTNGKLYVYASQNGGANHRSQVFEYTADDPLVSNTVDAGTQRSVLRFDQPFGNHNGGWIGFDPTATGDDRNYLYIATGDGGSARDPQNNSQDTTDNLLGKILRLDVANDDFPDDTILNYSIPPSNPFVGETGDDEIFAYGLRNPWRSSFDRNTGDLWIGDVGQGQIEEIDLLPKGTSGQNYGWRVMEGNRCFDAGDARDGNVACFEPSLTAPVYEYEHNNGQFGGFSVTGGYVYRGPVSEFQGQYFFADFATGHIWTRDPDSGNVLNRNAELASNRGQANSSVSSFGEDAAGNLYVLNYGGSLYRIDSTSREAVWDGTASVGTVGDGTSWDDADNWSRDGVADVAFESGDHLVLRATALSSSDSLRISALTLENGTLSIESDTEIVSGNVFVPDNSVGNISITGTGQFVGTTGTIRKLGGGDLDWNGNGTTASLLAVHDGNVKISGGNFDQVAVRNGGSLDLRQTRLETESLTVDEGGSVLLLGLPDASQPHEAESVSIAGHVEVYGPFERASFEDGELTILTATLAEELGEIRLNDVDDTLRQMNVGGETILGEWTQTANGSADLSLSLVQAIPGDTNIDGVVDFADFLIFTNNFGQPSFNGWLDGDFSGHGIIAFSDFLQLTENFGRTGFSTPAAAAAVPEPATGLSVLFAAAALPILSRRKRVQLVVSS